MKKDLVDNLVGELVQFDRHACRQYWKDLRGVKDYRAKAMHKVKLCSVQTPRAMG